MRLPPLPAALLSFAFVSHPLPRHTTTTTTTTTGQTTEPALVVPARMPPSAPETASLRDTLCVTPTEGVAVTAETPTTIATTNTPFPAIIGHRGALYAELENSLEGFVQCATWGCAGVELDAFCLPRDGSVVVFHGGGTDENPGDLSDYCLDQKGVSILDLTYEETQALRFNPDFRELVCPTEKLVHTHIPLLSQVLQALKGTGLEIKIELKGPDTVRPVLEIVDRLGMTSQCSYSSFDHAKLRLLRQLRPSTRDYPAGALFNTPVPADYVSQAQACGATQVHLRYDTCTKERVHDIRTAGLQSMAWLRGPLGMANVGTDEEACYRTLGETGVDQICCNRPDVAMQLQVLHARQP